MLEGCWKDAGRMLEGCWKNAGRMLEEGGWKEDGRTLEGRWKDAGRTLEGGREGGTDKPDKLQGYSCIALIGIRMNSQGALLTHPLLK